MQQVVWRATPQHLVCNSRFANRARRAICAVAAMQAALLAHVVVLAVASGAAATLHVLPTSLLHPPPPVEPFAAKIAGTVNTADVYHRPRAVLGYVSDKDWALTEFVTMIHASWRVITERNSAKLDLFLFADHRWVSQLSLLCTELDLDQPFERYADVHSQCFLVNYPTPPAEIWHGYPFINNVHFFADERVASIMTTHYGYIMKSDFDTFLAPKLLHVAPERMLFGSMKYQILPETAERLVRVAEDLGFRHRHRHNLGPTWLGAAADVVDMANRTIAVLHHIITQEFEQRPGGGIAQNWDAGEGWPQWSAGIAAMYATEIVANHFVEDFEVTDRMDVHSDSEWLVDDVIHIHCQHSDSDFNKFEFYRHHYDALGDTRRIDVSRVKGYATYLAVTAWRMMVGGEAHQPKQEL